MKPAPEKRPPHFFFRSFAMAFAVFCAFALASLWLANQQEQNLRKAVEDNSGYMARNIEASISGHFKSVERMAARVTAQKNKFNLATWRLDAANYLRDIPGLERIVITNGAFENIAAAHQPGDPAADDDLGKYLRNHAAAVLAGEGVDVIPEQSPGSPSDILFHVPVQYDKGVKGILIAEFNRDTLLRECLPDLIKAYYLVSFEPVPSTKLAGLSLDLRQTRTIYIGDAAQQIYIWPTQLLISARVSPLPLFVCLIGVLVAVLAGFLLRAVMLVYYNAEELRKSKEITDRIFKNSAVGKAIVSLHGKWLYVNPSLCRLLKYSEAELLATDFQSITHPEDLDKDLDLVGKMLRGEISTYQIEKRYFTGDKTYIWGLLSVSLVRKSNGTPDYFISQIQDLSDLKKAQSMQRQLIEKLESANMELERFVYIASHDMKEPLRMVCNFTELLGKEYGDKLDSGGKKYISIASTSAKRMSLLLDDLLDYARAGQDEKDDDVFDCRLCVDYALQNLEGQIFSRGASVKVGRLPTLVGSKIRFVTLMQNLIGNALKYGRKDGTGVVTVTAEDADDAYIFCVSDNGIGIKADYFEQIFEPFKRLHTVQEYPGTGMGLAICRKIVESAGGKIWLESKEGAGSSFFVKLPKFR